MSAWEDRAFQRGYAQAIADAIAALDHGGTDELRDWLIQAHR